MHRPPLPPRRRAATPAAVALVAVLAAGCSSPSLTGSSAPADSGQAAALGELETLFQDFLTLLLSDLGGLAQAAPSPSASAPATRMPATATPASPAPMEGDDEDAAESDADPVPASSAPAAPASGSTATLEDRVVGLVAEETGYPEATLRTLLDSSGLSFEAALAEVGLTPQEVAKLSDDELRALVREVLAEQT